MKPISIKKAQKIKESQAWSISKLSNISIVYILHYKWSGIHKTQKVILFFT